MFQFQTGAIKSLPTLCVTPRLISEFQFQTGAIKSVLPVSTTVAVHLFQFQTGAIKSECSLD